jgi:class 3 adenylate cyclase
MSVLFAATYPDRTHALIIYNGWVRRLRAPDWPHGPTIEEHEALVREFEERWGEAVGAELWAPSLAHLPEFREQWARFLRLAARPGVVGALFRMNQLIDIRGLLPAVRVPTLVIHRAGDRLVPVEQGRYAAKQIPNAKYVELPGDNHLFGAGDIDLVTDEIEEFLTGVRPVPEIDRVLATVLFTDIVGSTERAAALGDHAWRGLLEAHHEIARREVERHRGRAIEFVGDGLLATFDGPARAIRCACAIAEAVRTLGIEIRAGLHTGEVELAGSAVRGIAVHIGARVAAEAAAGEVLVSSTVKDLVAGSGIRFADRGPRALKGVPGEWRLFAAEYQRSA